MMNIIFVYVNPLKLPYIDLPIACLSAYIKANLKGINVTLIDYTFGLADKEAIRIFKNNKPELILFTARSNEFPDVVEKATLFRQNYKDAIYLLGGIHATINPEDAFRPCFDGICVGEGELALVEIIKRILHNQNYFSTGNFWFRKDGKIIKNQPYPLVTDLDNYPIMDYTIFNMGKYLSVRCGEIDYISGRGCPFNCTYCINHVLMEKYKGLGRYARIKSADAVIKELKYLKEEFKGKIKHIDFHDDMFNLFKERLKKLSETYKTQINLPFVCQLRADYCDEETIGYIAKMGCDRANIAIETGDEKLRFLLLNKKITDEQLISSFRLVSSHGIKTMSYNIIGLPNETVQQIRKTIALNQKCKPDSIQVSIFTPFDGTKIYDYCKEKGLLITTKLEKTYYCGYYLKNPYLSKKDLAHERMLFGFRYYIKFNIIKAMLILCRDVCIPYYLKINKYLPHIIKKTIFYLFWNFKPLKFLSK